MRRLLFVAGCVVLVLALLLLGSWHSRTLGPRLVSLGLGIAGWEVVEGQLAGSLSKGFTAHRLVLSDAHSARLVIDDADLSWRWSFAERRLTLPTARFGRLAWYSAETASAPQPGSSEIVLPDFSSPLAVVIDSLRIEKLQVFSPENSTIAQFDGFLSADDLRLEGSRFSLVELVVGDDTRSIVTRLNVMLAPPHTLVAAVDAELPGQSAAIALDGALDDWTMQARARYESAQLQIDDAELRATGDVRAVRSFELNAPTSLGILLAEGGLRWSPNFSASVQLRSDKVHVDQLSDGRFEPAALDARLDLTPEHYLARADLSTVVSQRPLSLHLQFDGNSSGGSLAGSYLESDADRLELSGELAWNDGLVARIEALATQFDLRGFCPACEGRTDLESVLRFDRGRFDLALQSSGVFSDKPVDIAAQFSGDDSLVEVETLTLRGSQSTVKLQGEVALQAEPRGRFMLSGKLNDDWLPVAGYLDLQGEIDSLGSTLSSHVLARGVLSDLPSTITLTAKAAPERIDLKALEITTDAGYLRVDGVVTPAGSPGADLNLEANDFNPAVFASAYPGQLDFKGKAKVEQDRVSLVLNGGGQLRDYPLRVAANLDGNREAVTIQELKIRSGANELELEGALSAREFDRIRWRLDAPELAVLADNLEGSIAGQGSIDGSFDQPLAAAQLQAKAIRMGEFSLAEARFELQADTEQQLSLSVVANGGASPWIELDELQASARGTREQLEGKIHAKSMRGDSIDASGQWFGSDEAHLLLEALHLQQQGYPALQLEKALRIPLQQVASQPQAACLVSSRERLCITAAKEDSTLQGAIEIETLMLARLATAEGSQRAPGLLSGGATIERRDGRLLANGDFMVDQHTQLVSELSLQGNGTLGGRVEARIDDLGKLAILDRYRLDPEGGLDVALQISGTRTQPIFNGDIRLDGGAMNLLPAGVRMTDIQASLVAQGTGVAQVRGRVHSGEGQLDLEGQLEYRNWPQWKLELKVDGERVLAVDRPDVRLLASPKLVVQASASEVELTGELKIPEAEIVLSEISEGAITVTPDQRFVRPDDDTGEAGDGTSLRVRTQVELGDDVWLRGRGLQLRLNGGLDYNQRPGESATGQGRIQLNEGSYTAYGQDLSLDEGALTFSGPLTNPGVDLVARRSIGKQRVGIRVSGQLQNLSSEIFSEPALSESDAIAYLITGKPLARTDGNENQAILSALTRFGVRGSAPVISDIRSATGLSTLELESGQNFEDTALLVGTYLTPKLYIEYAKRLFAENDAVMLRYEFNDRFQLEAEAGQQQGIDLIYQRER